LPFKILRVARGYNTWGGDAKYAASGELAAKYAKLTEDWPDGINFIAVLILLE
jgi:hypothetical protein